MRFPMKSRTKEEIFREIEELKNELQALDKAEEQKATNFFSQLGHPLEHPGCSSLLGLRVGGWINP